MQGPAVVELRFGWNPQLRDSSEAFVQGLGLGFKEEVVHGRVGTGTGCHATGGQVRPKFAKFGAGCESYFMKRLQPLFTTKRSDEGMGRGMHIGTQFSEACSSLRQYNIPSRSRNFDYNLKPKSTLTRTHRRTAPPHRGQHPPLRFPPAPLHDRSSD